MVIPGADGDTWVMCPGARMAGLGGPCGRMNRKKTRHIEIAALMMMRRVICRLAMAGCKVENCARGRWTSPQPDKMNWTGCSLAEQGKEGSG